MNQFDFLTLLIFKTYNESMKAFFFTWNTFFANKKSRFLNNWFANILIKMTHYLDLLIFHFLYNVNKKWRINFAQRWYPYQWTNCEVGSLLVENFQPITRLFSQFIILAKVSFYAKGLLVNNVRTFLSIFYQQSN